MTIDKTRLPVRTGQLPAFTPVPRQTSRHDGWTDERQRRFIEALADTGSVKAAAHRVNMTPEGAYLLRRHAQGASFRQAWEAALALGVQQLEDIAMERALYGQEVPVYSYGKLIGSRIVHNDRLLMFMLRNRAPTRFSADGRALARQNTIGNPVKAAELARLKKQWRKEWEQERAAEEDPEAALDALDQMFERTRQQQIEQMAPRTRRLFEAYQRSQDIDRQRRARRDLLAMPRTAKCRLWDGVESHPPRSEMDEDYRADALGTLAEEEAENERERAKLKRRGIS